MSYLGKYQTFRLIKFNNSALDIVKIMPAVDRSVGTSVWYAFPRMTAVWVGDLCIRKYGHVVPILASFAILINLFINNFHQIA